MKYLRITPGARLKGELNFPGDKSLTHRALIIGSIHRAGCEVTLKNWLPSLDCIATMNAMQSMGVNFTHLNANTVVLQSVGLKGLQKPSAMLEAGNSGTAIRLLTGLLAAQDFSSVITGDASICKRPMQRIIKPLSLMGAKITAIDSEYAPLAIHGGQTLVAINYAMPVASAQVKSAILLAGLYAAGATSVTSPSVCRDHTEIMLDYFAQLPRAAGEIVMDIPSDLSSAAFFMVGACIVPGSHLILRNIGINPTRAGVINILQLMGADITLLKQRCINGEWRADVQVRYRQQLQAINVPAAIVANAIDELPAICLAAACANGITVIRGASELRHKESDRIAMLLNGFRRLGLEVNEYHDGLALTGGVLSGGEVASGGDHRIAMTFAMAGLVAQQEIIVQDTANIATSFPNFMQVATNAGMLITEESLCPI